LHFELMMHAAQAGDLALRLIPDASKFADQALVVELEMPDRGDMRSDHRQRAEIRRGPILALV
jgi:hypothetical protein